MGDLAPLFASSVLSVKAIEKNPGVAKKIIKATEKSIQFIEENPEEALLIMAMYTGYDQNLIKGMMMPHYSKLNEINKEGMQDLANRLYKKEILRKRIDVGNLIYR